MAISIPPDTAESVHSDTGAFEKKQLNSNRLLMPMATEQEIYKFERKHYVKTDQSNATGNGLFSVKSPLQSRDYRDKIEYTGFLLNKPWLPSNALKLLNKLKQGPISEMRLVELMKLVAERASIHFQLSEGKFVAMTFDGQIVETSDTRIGLLKKIQGQRYREQIFVWKVDSDAFSGRL